MHISNSKPIHSLLLMIRANLITGARLLSQLKYRSTLLACFLSPVATRISPFTGRHREPRADDSSRLPRGCKGPKAVPSPD
jgi:hypothetical protein